MGLYSIYSDTKQYRNLGFDRNQSRDIFGEDIKDQFDVNFEAKPYAKLWKSMDVNFVDDGSGLSGSLIPDISEHNGRLFLSQKSYDTLKDLLTQDGEFLPVLYEHGAAFLFNPLSLAESVNGLDTNLSIRNEWGDIENMAFHEERVKDFVIFRSKFDNYRSAFCNDILKDAITSAGLKGVFFTPDLGNPYTLDLAKNLQNG
jgi:hypothetical protein